MALQEWIDCPCCGGLDHALLTVGNWGSELHCCSCGYEESESFPVEVA